MVLLWKICETVFKVGLTTVFFYTVVISPTLLETVRGKRFIEKKLTMHVHCECLLFSKKVKVKHFYFTTVTAKLEACICWPLTFRYYPQLSWYLFTQLGEPKHVDFRENLLKALTQVTSGVSVDSNPRLVDSQPATLTTRPLRSIYKVDCWRCIK